MLLCLVAQSCLLVQALRRKIARGQDDQIKVAQINKQILGVKKTDTNSYEGKPLATSSLNDSNKNAASVESVSAVQISMKQGNYMAKTDSFHQDVMNNGFYFLSAAEFLNKSNEVKNWAIVDVRPPQLYAADHIPGAMNIPLGNLILQRGMVPVGQKVAVYCAIDANAAFAVQTLRVYGGHDGICPLDEIVAWHAARISVVI